MADQTKVSVDVELSQQSAAKTIKDADALVKQLERKLRGLGVDWSKVAKQASSVTSEIHAISDSAETFARKLGSAAVASLGDLKRLGDQLEDAKEAAAQLEEQYRNAKSDSARSYVEQAMAEQAKEIAGLTQKIHAERGARTKELTQLTKLIKLQDRYQKTVQDAAEFDMGDALSSAFGKLKGGDFKGMFKDLGGGLFKNIGSKYAQGAMGKAEAAGGMGTAEGAAGIAKAAKALGVASGVLAGAVAGFAAFVALVKAASDHMTGLNKALIQGMGFANDMVSDAKGYRKVMDEMRNAAIDSHGAMLKFGKNSEDVLKVINAYAKDSTGSLIKTRNAMEDMGGGSLKLGVEQFAKSAISYGAALNMEASEVASMMGKFQSEMGYGANQVQGLMQDVVRAASTASMPMTKFMDIFKSVIPDVELYQNRLEELTGTIKLLSKTMSPKDVKNFMEAFSRGFKGVDFKQRLKTALVVGVPKVSEIAAKDFSGKAANMAAKFGKYLGVEGPKKFMTAFSKGEKGMAGLINEMQATASQMGESLSGTDIGEAMKLASYEAARQKGDPLSMATAMRGMGMYGTYKVLKEMSQRFKTGFDGMGEHVIAQLGISDQQYEALRNTNQSMTVWKDMLQEYGETNSKSMNEALKEQISIRKYGDKNHKEMVNLREATEEDIFEASQRHEEDSKFDVTAEDLAQEQVSATTSISEKITNVIAFLLEKLYKVMSPLLDSLDGIWNWLVGGEQEKKQAANLKKATDAWTQQKGPGAEAEQMKMVSEQLQKGLTSGKRGGDLGEYLASSGVLTADDIKQNFDMSQIGKYLESKGVGASEAATIQEKFFQSMKNNDMTKAMKDLGDDVSQFKVSSGELYVNLFGKMGPTDAAKQRADYGASSSRPGWESKAGPRNKKERMEAEKLAIKAGDINVLGPKRSDVKAGTAPAATPGKPLVVPDNVKHPKTEADWKKRDELVAKGLIDPQTGEPTTRTGSTTVERAGTQTSTPTAGATRTGTTVPGLPPTPGQPATSKPGQPAPSSREQVKAADKSAALLDSINVQAMGMMGYLEDISKLLGEKGIVINKEKFRAQIVNGPIKDVLDKALADAFLDYWLYSAKNEDIEGQLAWAKKNNLKDLTEFGEMARGTWTQLYQLKDTKKQGTKDFGGTIETTGYYRLMRGEEVVNPNLNGGSGSGSGSGKAVTINATINVSGAQNPEAVAAQVRKVLYDMSEKH